MLDTLSAIIDLVILLRSPKFMNSKQRLKLARQNDIDQSFRSKRKSSLNTTTSDKCRPMSEAINTSVLGTSQK